MLTHALEGLNLYQNVCTIVIIMVWAMMVLVGIQTYLRKAK